MKLMLLMTIKTTRLHRRGGMKNDSWRVTVGFPTPSDHRWGEETDRGCTIVSLGCCRLVQLPQKL